MEYVRGRRQPRFPTKNGRRRAAYFTMVIFTNQSRGALARELVRMKDRDDRPSRGAVVGISDVHKWVQR